VAIGPGVLAGFASHPAYEEAMHEAVVPLRDEWRRAWFSEWAYNCLPLTMANRHGFALRSLYGFRVRWNGGPGRGDVRVEMTDANAERIHRKAQLTKAQFGMGTFTVQYLWTLRTPRNVNLLVGPVPNHMIDGIVPMAAVVESDNLRRDFGFTIRVTRKNRWISVPRGSWLAWVMPYPRHFIDAYSFKSAAQVVSARVIAEERNALLYAGFQRRHVDKAKPNRLGRNYLRGTDPFGNRFRDHQVRLDPPA
jgi:hypothetical protein